MVTLKQSPSEALGMRMIDAGLIDEQKNVLEGIGPFRCSECTLASDLATVAEHIGKVHSAAPRVLTVILEYALDDSERKALDALGRYKFEMFGYHASGWVKYNRILGGHRANPFRVLVDAARTMRETTDALEARWFPTERQGGS